MGLARCADVDHIDVVAVDHGRPVRRGLGPAVVGGGCLDRGVVATDEHLLLTHGVSGRNALTLRQAFECAFPMNE